METKKYNGKVSKRRGLWRIIYRHNGKEQRQSVARILRMPPKAVTEKMAKQVLEDTLRNLYQDRWVDPRHRKLTLGDCLDQLVVKMALKDNKSLARETKLIGLIKEMVGHYSAQDVKTHVVETWAREWLKTSAPATIEKRCIYICGALRLAVKQERLTKAPDRPEIGVDNARQGFVSPEQAAPLIAALNRPGPAPQPRYRDVTAVADVIEWAFHTAWRKGEILALRWEYVDREAAQITLPETKNDDARVLPIVGVVADLIERRWRARALGCPWVFHRHGRRLSESAVQRHFKRVARAAGLPELFVHDLRRSAVREMEITHGVPRPIAMKISGHRSEAIYKRYAITNTEDIASALRGMEQTRTRNADKRRTIAGGVGGQHQ